LLTNETMVHNNRRFRAWQFTKHSMRGGMSKFTDRIDSTLKFLTENIELSLIFLSPPVNGPYFSISKNINPPPIELAEKKTVVLARGNDRKMALGDRTYKENDRRLTESFYIKGLPLSVALSVLSDIHQSIYFPKDGMNWKP
jgi:hypothetical protein